MQPPCTVSCVRMLPCKSAEKKSEYVHYDSVELKERESEREKLKESERTPALTRR